MAGRRYVFGKKTKEKNTYNKECEKKKTKKRLSLHSILLVYIFYVHWHMIARELFQLVRHVGHTEEQAEKESRRLLHLLTVSLWNLQKSFIFCQYAMHTIHNCTHIPIPSIDTQIHIFLPPFLYLSVSPSPSLSIITFMIYLHLHC